MVFAVFVHLIACLAVVLLPIAVDDSDASSPSQANAESNAGTKCAWDCNIIDPELGLEMKALISQFKIVTVRLKYEQPEEKQCSNHTDLKRNSSLAEFWIWQTCHIPSHGGQNMSQHSFNKSNNWFQKSLEGQIEVGVSCSLKPAADSNDTNPSVNDVIAMVLLEEVANFTKFPRSAFCYSLSANNGSYVCVNLTSNIARTTDDIVPVTWQIKVFRVLVGIVLVISLWYLVLLLWLFTPTEFKDKGTEQVMILLHGTSPQGVRSWIANKLASFDDSTEGKRFLPALFFFLFAIGFLFFEVYVIDVYLVPPKLLLDIDTWNSRLNVLIYSHGLLTVVCLVRIYLRRQTKYCFICRDYGDKEDICHDKKHPKYYGLKEMKMHLLIQPVIVVRCLTKFVTSFEDCCSRRSLVKLLYFSLLLLSPLWFPIYLLYVAFLLLYSSPLSTLYYMLCTQGLQKRALKKRCKTFGRAILILETNFIIIGYFCIALVIASGSVTIIRNCLLRLPNYLTFASLGLVIIYYLWKVYAPYPREHNDLAFKVEKYYAKRVDAKDKPVCYTQDCLRVIPKELYEETCKKLMPLEESRSELALKFFALLFFIFLVSVVITESPKIDDEAKAVGTLLTLFFPKIVEVFFGEYPAVKKANEDALDKRVESVVEEYLAKRQQRNSNTANQDTNNNNNNNCTSGGNEGFQISHGIVNGNSDNGSSEAGNERARVGLIINPFSDITPLISYGTFDHSEDTAQQRTATGTLSASSELTLD